MSSPPSQLQYIRRLAPLLFQAFGLPQCLKDKKKKQKKKKKKTEKKTKKKTRECDFLSRSPRKKTAKTKKQKQTKQNKKGRRSTVDRLV